MQAMLESISILRYYGSLFVSFAYCSSSMTIYLPVDWDGASATNYCSITTSSFSFFEFRRLSVAAS